MEKPCCETIKKEEQKSKKDERVKKSSLVTAIIGVGIAVFTFICCGLLIPLGLIGAAVFLHQYRIPLIILGILMAGVSVFFMLRGKNIICVYKIFDLIKKHKNLAIISIGIIIFVGTAIFLGSNFLVAPTKNFSSPNQLKSTLSEWKNSKAESKLVGLVNFLNRNRGKEIELNGKKHLINGKEVIDVKIVMLECCTKGEFAGILDKITKIGEVRGSDFNQKKIIAKLPAEEIPKITDIWNVETINLELDTQVLWESIIKGF